MPAIRIMRARTSADIASARDLFLDYVNWLARDHGIDLAFQNIDDELAQLPGKYSPPGGEILLAKNEANTVLGVIALRPYEASTCEVKRLYVLEQARGHSLGKRLIGQIIKIAIEANYEQAILDTGGFMKAAQKLYQDFGFRDIPPYYNNPVPGMRFMGADLRKINIDQLC